MSFALYILAVVPKFSKSCPAVANLSTISRIRRSGDQDPRNGVTIKNTISRIRNQDQGQRSKTWHLAHLHL